MPLQYVIYAILKKQLPPTMQQFDKCFICSILCTPSLLLRKLRLNACMLSCFSHVQLSATLQTVAHQAPLSMGFSRQKYWSGLPCSPAGDLPNPEIEPASLASPALAGEFFTTSANWEAHLPNLFHPKSFPFQQVANPSSSGSV